MIITKCKGYELEKEKSNTSEDFFNRSEITFIEDGEEKTLHILYVRYFDEQFQQFTPYESEPVFQAGSQDIYVRDLVALVCLIKNPGFRHRKRVYINTLPEFSSYFKDIDYDKLPAIFKGLEEKNRYDLKSPLEFLAQMK